MQLLGEPCVCIQPRKGEQMRIQTLGLLAAMALLLPAPAFAQSSWLYEIRGGVLAHDVPIVACCRYENGVSANAELAFAPSLPLFGGAIRPVFGGSFTFDARAGRFGAICGQFAVVWMTDAPEAAAFSTFVDLSADQRKLASS